jgi:hypothetical protein
MLTMRRQRPVRMYGLRRDRIPPPVAPNGILDSMEESAAPQLYKGIDHFITTLQGTQETGGVATFENGPYPGILVRIDGRAIGAVALEQGETRETLSARVHELVS